MQPQVDHSLSFVGRREVCSLRPKSRKMKNNARPFRLAAEGSGVVFLGELRSGKALRRFGWAYRLSTMAATMPVAVATYSAMLNFLTTSTS